MARKLHRELNNRHIQLIAIGGRNWNWVIPRIRSNNILTGPSLLFTYMIIGVVLAFMRALGELLLSNTRFNSFVDIANEYLGPLVALSLAGLTGYVGLYQVCRPNCDGTILCILVSTSPKLDYRAIYCFNLD